MLRTWSTPGPEYRSMTKEGSSIKLSFNNVGRGLQAKGDKYGYLKGFAIAGTDKKFYLGKGPDRQEMMSWCKVTK